MAVVTFSWIQRGRAETFGVQPGRHRTVIGGWTCQACGSGSLAIASCIGWQEIEGIARGIMVLGIAAAAVLFLADQSEAGDSSGESPDGCDAGGDD